MCQACNDLLYANSNGLFSFVATVHSAVGGAVGGAVTAPISSDTDREMEATQLPPQGK